MCAMLGRSTAIVLAGMAALIASSAATAEEGTTGDGSEETTTTVVTTAPPAAVPAETTATTTATTTAPTAAPSTTTPVTAAELSVGVVAVPERGEQLQVAPTYPPPITTTTVASAWQLPANSGEGRRVVYSKSRQRVWTVEADGRVSKMHLVSGRLTWNQPLPGTYSVFSRSGYTCNINNPHICWRYMVRFTRGPDGDNIGFHEIPTNLKTGYRLQSVSQLGQALSGGCVRQATSDATYMWNWAPIGTKVVVTA